MSALKDFMLNEPRLNTAEFAARMYPDKSRYDARSQVHNSLHSAYDSASLLALLAVQVELLASELLQAIPTASGKQLLCLASDKRVRQKYFTHKLYPAFASGTSTRYWIAAREGSREFTSAECETLRAELQKLADACVEALK